MVPQSINFPPSHSTIPNNSKSLSTETFKDELVRRLDIPHTLVGSGEATLQVAYQKYEAFLAAFKKYTEMKNGGTWQGKKPTKTDLMEIFASKSYFHSHYNAFFPKVAGYHNLQAWLRNSEDKESNEEVWGVHKEVYNFKDLKIFLENKGSLVEKRAEGRKKDKGRGGGRDRDRKEVPESQKNKKKKKNDGKK